MRFSKRFRARRFNQGLCASHWQPLLVISKRSGFSLLKGKIAMSPTVLLTGASGYVGGRVLQRLRKCSLSVRCLSRHPDYLLAHVPDDVEVVRGDGLDP